MFWSKAFIPTLKDTPQEAESISHKLMLRAGLIRMLIAGVYSYLPLGLKVLDNIEKIIREEMRTAGANELLLPALQSQDLWVRSGRDKAIGDVMFRFKDRRGRNLCLGPTHEEVITELVKSQVSSYRQLPLVLYQIQTKFRDEIRPRFGLVRGCEFIMKDAYSFDLDEAGLEENYKKMFEAYKRIFSRCGLQVLAIEADPGVMGGNVSHEFMVPAESGEDAVWICRSCNQFQPVSDKDQPRCNMCGKSMHKTNAIEIGHIFKLGTKYSSVLEACFLDTRGEKKPMIMGCYGIGVSRLIPTVIEQNHDDAGIIWPYEISPYKVIILPLDVTADVIMGRAIEMYEELRKQGIEVLLDDRDERAGVKFKDADLIGIPFACIIGKESLKHDTVEIVCRKTKEKFTGSCAAAGAYLKEKLGTG